MRYTCLVLTLACTTDHRAVETTSEPSPPNFDDISEQARLDLAEMGQDSLVWSITPYRGDENTHNPYEPLVEYISERIGISLQLEVGTDYADLEHKIATGQTDIAVLGPYSYVRAKRESAEINVFASHIARGNITYGTYIISRADSPVQTIADLPGHTMAYVALGSASGWLFPASRMLEEGIHPIDDVIPIWAGDHNEVIQKVKSGEAQAGATYADRYHEESQTPSHDLHIVAKGGLVPHDAYVLREGLPASIGQAIGQALIEVSNQHDVGRQLLQSLHSINGFIAVDDTHFDPVRVVESSVQDVIGSSP